MNKGKIDKIFSDVAYALGKAEYKHPNFCQMFEDPKSDQDLNYNFLRMYRAENKKAEDANNENCENVLFEEVYELLTAANDPQRAYAEACDVAVVAIRIMEFFLNRGANIEKV